MDDFAQMSCGADEPRRTPFPLSFVEPGCRATRRALMSLPRPEEALCGMIIGFERALRWQAPQGKLVARDAPLLWEHPGTNRQLLRRRLFEARRLPFEGVAPCLTYVEHDQAHHRMLEDLCAMAFGKHSSCNIRAFYGWGGVVILDDTKLQADVGQDDLLPFSGEALGIMGVWKDVSRAVLGQAMSDLDLLLGSLLSSMLYPAMPFPAPPGSHLGLDFLPASMAL